jgi:thymidine phosphorylase
MRAAGAATGRPSVSIHSLRFRQLGIDTWLEHVVYMHRECSVCRAEGFSAQARVLVGLRERSIVATLNVVESPLLSAGEISLSAGAARALAAVSGDVLAVSHAPALESLSALRAKIYGHRLQAEELDAVIGDVAAGRYSDVHIAAFLAACAGGRMDVKETVDLTRAMVQAGERLRWSSPVVADKHCVGGLPGNRTTPIVVAIAAAAGLVCPKTSSRAITSPAGTADTMEVLTHVALTVAQMRRVVEHQGACIAWGGAVSLSPADDVLIRVERPLDLDSDAQLVASVLSKKIAAGSSHVLIDMPVGPTAKVRNSDSALRLQCLFSAVADALGVNVRVVKTDGTQPVGRGIGPALEARDVLAVLRGERDAPQDLRERALLLAGSLLAFCTSVQEDEAHRRVACLLDSGVAWQRFQGICEAQGGLREPPQALLQERVLAAHPGVVQAIDCRSLSRGARLAGAPRQPAAGLDLHVRLGQVVTAGQPLFTLHAQARGELDYARAYLDAHAPIHLEAIA